MKSVDEWPPEAQGRLSGRPTFVLVVDAVKMRIWMHESGTSAVATFIDEGGREHRVSLIARAGGGALTTGVSPAYERQLQLLGALLWPKSGDPQDPTALRSA